MIIYLLRLDVIVKSINEQFYNPSEIIINIDADNNVSTGFFVNNIDLNMVLIFLIELSLTTLILISLILYLFMN